MAAQHAAGSDSRASDSSVDLYGIHGVLRASWIKAANWQSIARKQAVGTNPAEESSLQ